MPTDPTKEAKFQDKAPGRVDKPGGSTGTTGDTGSTGGGMDIGTGGVGGGMGDYGSGTSPLGTGVTGTGDLPTEGPRPKLRGGQLGPVDTRDIGTDHLAENFPSSVEQTGGKHDAPGGIGGEGDIGDDVEPQSSGPGPGE